MTFLSVYRSLYKHYGPQSWWPGDTPFEIMVGAVLTQNTAWINVEKAIAHLKHGRALSLNKIAAMPAAQLARLIKPAGYFNVKAKRLQNFCRWLQQQGGEKVIREWDDDELRRGLLSVNGVGFETADDMMLYAFDRPVFVIDAYTRRLFARLGLIDGDEAYETLRHLFESNLSRRIKTRAQQVQMYNEYHALIVIHAKDICRKRARCSECCLRRQCPAALQPENLS
ncbi:endonuclease [Candidatus Tenderia electrophaga]|jgi:endonuclease-3 related protein|uniref:Endonuclease n=1 Tax=Candidatus Tenderia electrophaga TaxID=1748243 RepID=A0A0S2TE24_9GAMM|nr:endonuclease [Candidatus Tenderia electrophaga]